MENTVFECPDCGRIITRYNYIRHSQSVYHLVRKDGLKPKKINKIKLNKKIVNEIKVSF